VNELVPNSELKQRAHDLAKELASMPPISVAEVLRCVVGVSERPLQEGIYEERQGVLRAMGTKDSQEGMMAFRQKREPHFTGE